MATPEERTGRYWITVAWSTIAACAEVLGWDRVMELYLAGARGRGTKATTMILEKLKIKERDATVPPRIIEAVVPTILPGWKSETHEASPERAVHRNVGVCLMWEVVKELGLQEKFPVDRVCETFCDAVCEVVNPKLTFTQPKKICKSDPYCEIVFEIKE
jgi:hypothetical protein